MYQLPPKEIADLVLADPAPTISVDSKAKMMLLMGRSSYPLVEELGQVEVQHGILQKQKLLFIT